MLVDINKITVKDRVRKDFGDISELARDIQENGLINPPVVIPESDGTFTLLAGERRLRALKSLGKTDIEVRTWGKLTGEEALNIEISENEVRKDFSKAERIDYARRLERIESEKAKERQGIRNDIVENFPRSKETKTRDIVAEKMGIGSGRQYEKEKTIVDNKHLLDPSDFAEWDEGKLSTNKAYQKVKAELDAKNRLISDLQNRPLEIKEVIKEVIPNDYEDVKKRLKSAEYTAQRAENDFNRVRKEAEDRKKRIEELEAQIGTDNKLRNANLTINYFTNATTDYIRRYGGSVWAFSEIDNVDEATRTGFINAIKSLNAFTQQLIRNIGGGIE